MRNSADVVIIGAGVIGCSTAYHLANMGIKDVAVLEMDQVGAGSSSKSAAMLSMQFGGDKSIAQLAQYSYDRYMELESELRIVINFQRTGRLLLAPKKHAERLLGYAEILQSLGIETEIVEPAEIKVRYPEINVEDIVVGTWGPDDGSFDPHMIIWGFINRACEMGVRLHQGVRARGIQVTEGRVEGVTTERGFISTNTVVNAGGPWANEIGSWVGVEIPIINLARTIVVTDSFPDIPSTRPFVDDVGAEWYYRPEGEGILMGMGKRQVEKFDIPTDFEMIDKMIDVAVHRVPLLKGASMLTAWTGLRPLTPDSKPILGPVPSIDGLVLNCGWGGMGIIQAPAAGLLMAELISEGHTSTFDIHSMGIDRFVSDPSL